MNSRHPFESYIPEGATKLIIGTIPPQRFCKKPQELFKDDINYYYGSKDNYFWPLLEDVFSRLFKNENMDSAIVERKNLLRDNSTGITDIIYECIHFNNSASDKDLKEIKNKDIAGLLTEFPSIETLIYTSEFVKSQINLVFKTYHSIDKNDRKKQTVKIGNRKYNVRILYSPSPQALRNMGVNGKEKRKKQYREFLLEK